MRIAPSALSAILNGKRPLTEKTKLRLGLALGFNLNEMKQFAPKTRSRSNARARSAPPRFQQLALDTYAVIADWYHYAILELIRVESFKPDSKWIARALGISASEVNIAVERLIRVGLLRIDSGRWIDTSENGLATNIHDDLTSEASRKLQMQVLEKSMKALEALSTSVRNHTSMTMAIHPEDLVEAKERIARFRRELCDFFERSPRPTAVYQLGISLYPLTQNSSPSRKGE